MWVTAVECLPEAFCEGVVVDLELCNLEWYDYIIFVSLFVSLLKHFLGSFEILKYQNSLKKLVPT